jgi:hypothetical protein
MGMFSSTTDRQTAYAIMNENKGSFVTMVGTASTKYTDELKLVSHAEIKAIKCRTVKPEASVSI